MNVYDIAKRAGVSIATVSRVLNHPDAVSPATAERVQKAIEECDYTPSLLARGLGRGSMRTVGVICKDLTDIYDATAVAFIEKELRGQGYDIIPSCGKDAIGKLISKGVDAIFIIGSGSEALEKAAHKLPVIIINGECDADGVHCFVTNVEDSVAHAVERLARDGRRSILYLYDEKTPCGNHKFGGYHRGIINMGLSPNAIKTEKNLHAVQSALGELMVLGMPFDAIIASDDVLAALALKVLIKQNIAVPREVAVIGIDNLPFTELCTPSVTSIDIKLGELC